MRSAAAAAGDTDTATKAFEAVLALGQRLRARDKLRMVESIAVAYYRNKDYAEGGAVGAALLQGRRQRLRDAHAAAPELVPRRRLRRRREHDAAARATRRQQGARGGAADPRQLLPASRRTTTGYVARIEKLVIYYPKKEYWADLLSRVQRKPGFSDRLARARLPAAARHRQHRRAPTTTWRWRSSRCRPAFRPRPRRSSTRASRRACSARAPRPSATSACATSWTRSSTSSQKTRAQDEKDALAAKDGNDLVKVGLNYVYEGQADKGLALIEQGITKGGLKRPEDAKLHLRRGA